MKTNPIYVPLLAAILFLAAPSANALMVIQISSGGITETITDEDLRDLAPGLEGIISAPVLSVNGWTIVTTAGISNSHLDESIDSLDLVSLSMTSGSSISDPKTIDPLTIKLTSTGYTKGDSVVGTVSGVGGTTDGSVSFQSYLDTSNTAFGEGTLLADSGNLTGYAFSYAKSRGVQTSSMYSLTAVATIFHDKIGNLTSFDFGIKVPEPATLALLGIGLILIGFAGKNKQKYTI
jgi:hypothetical protein